MHLNTSFFRRNWLQRHLPRDSALGLERYTDPAQLNVGQAAHYLHAGLADQALATLTNAAPPCWNELELQRLELSALTAARAEPERIVQAARQLLQKSPDYWPALQVIDPATAQRLPANLANPIRFPPLLALVGIQEGVPDAPRTAASTNQFALIFEALDDDTPPLAVLIHRRHNRGWREGLRLPIASANRRLQRGERVAVRFEPGASGDAKCASADIGIAVQANVRWSPGTLQPRRPARPNNFPAGNQITRQKLVRLDEHCGVRCLI